MQVDINSSNNSLKTPLNNACNLPKCDDGSPQSPEPAAEQNYKTRPRRSASFVIKASTCAILLVVTYLTFVCKWRPGTYEFYIIILLLAAVLAVLSLVAEDGMLRERFLVDGTEGLNAALQELAAVPVSIKSILVDSLDALSSAYKANEEEENEEEKNTDNPISHTSVNADSKKHEVELSPKLYEGDPTLASGGTVDEAKYKVMAGEYAMLHYMLCTLKLSRPSAYASMFRQVLGRDPTPEPAPVPGQAPPQQPQPEPQPEPQPQPQAV
jgi:hypothetical protein